MQRSMFSMYDVFRAAHPSCSVDVAAELLDGRPCHQVVAVSNHPKVEFGQQPLADILQDGEREEDEGEDLRNVEEFILTDRRQLVDYGVQPLGRLRSLLFLVLLVNTLPHLGAKLTKEVGEGGHHCGIRGDTDSV